MPDPPRQIPTSRVQRMTSTDFSEVLRPSNRCSGDLRTAPLPLCWPALDGNPRVDDEALRRLEYSTAQRREFFESDPTCQAVKVVTEDGEITCIGRWSFLPNGYDFDTHHVVPITGFVPSGAVAPEGPFQIDFYRDLIHGMMRLRRDWMPKAPCWGESASQ
ncbi:hypothetical protein LTR53_015245 [Teratosphaeriaceae sp. CCFEE 6253]|nr:hypothetical protein LTR53_015245 [Teratosphaeriaceae sp. CCFEE 6253]